MVARSTGDVRSARGLGLHDHVCWLYDHPEELRVQVTTFVTEGLDQGLRVLYVTGDSEQSQRNDLAGVSMLDEAMERGALDLAFVDDVYRHDATAGTGFPIAIYERLIAEALADGYAGLRLAVEATPLVQSIEGLAAFVGSELLMDGVMVRQPFSALCAFNRSEIASPATATLASVHPCSTPGATTFHLAADSNGADVSIVGEIDFDTQPLFESTLDCFPFNGHGLVIDATRLGFIDHRGLATLGHLHARSGIPVTFRTHSPVPARLVSLLDIPGIVFD
jgi:anti-anti-sigma regulatory factor